MPVNAAHVVKIHLTAEVPGLPGVRVPFPSYVADRSPMWGRDAAARVTARKAARQAEWDADKPRRDAIEAARQTDRPYGQQPRGF
jgi:hypothetical protein